MHQGCEVVVGAVVGGFHNWRFEGAKPGEGDMSFEGVVWSVGACYRHSRGSWRREDGRAIRVGACDVACDVAGGRGSVVYLIQIGDFEGDDVMCGVSGQ